MVKRFKLPPKIHNELKALLKNQNKLFEDLLKKQQAEPRAVAPGPHNVPLPPPLSLEGDMDENYAFFEDNWNNYATAVGMGDWPEADNLKKVSFLLSIVGPDALKRFSNFDLTQADRATPTTVLAAIKKNQKPQSPVESIDEYTSRLKSLAKPAKLGAVEAELITFKLATSNKWPHLRSKMLTMADLSEAKAVDLCRVEEITAKHVQVLSADKLSEVNKLKASSSKARQCKFCGDWHAFTKGSCPAY
ncbi:tetratricopeptide repeat protein, tpr [Culex quinquefasciatus]|uniref:Tetratricopeptide repeat protein, tpr n=1 Tax=Culex quinquefasciatus TaxID=7176 RepID=B0WX87_CULQU|nr:tetratricopeptide repeat protein, tpr [Culex quinquefasciatus]|eukprot:XP_001862009.1 tetratricopeptide repeat protein, tpr [Culex quinquefasciatus]